jgi:UPF0755 protein
VPETTSTSDTGDASGPFDQDASDSMPRATTALADPDVAADDAVVYLPPERSWLHRRGPALFVAVLVLFLILAGGAWWVAKQVNPGGAPGAPVTVAIPDGSSDNQIASILAAKGVVGNATVFRYYVKLTNGGPFKAGVYDGLRKHEAMGDVVKRLDKGPLPPATRTLIIPEGLWVSEIKARILKTFPEMKPADVDAAIASAHSKYMPPGTTNPEGFLFPATYQVLLTDVADPRKLIDQMTAKFDEEADSVGLGQGAAKVGMTPYQALTSASMIEEEAKVPQDRAKIARVILNRLAAKMPLGLDSTVDYALGQRVPSLTNSQLQVSSPYNTRVHAGLPPTPISSPGRASLLAALNPEPGNWIYFVLADKSGAHYFTNSYRDFQAATERARKAGLLGG